VSDQSPETVSAQRQLASDRENMPAEATRRRGLVGRLRARPKLTVALLVATVMATQLVGVYIDRNGYWKHYDDTPSGVVEHVIDIVLVHRRERQPSPLPDLLCTPDNNRLGALKWTLVKNIDSPKTVKRYRFETDRWSVTETGSRARVTVGITALVDEDPQYNVTQLWEFNLEHTDRWRTCSSSQIS
jgi:hypothetical protein